LTTVVLLVLAGIWAVVLLAPLVRARADGALGDTIGSFRRHLSVLERAAPSTVSPANRLRNPSSQVAIPPYRPPASPMRRRDPLGYPRAASPAVLRRRRAQRRRRDVLFTLVAAMAGSLLLAFIPGLSVMMWVHILIDVLFVGYLGLLIRIRNVIAEREMKLTFLPSPAAVPAAAGYGPYRGSPSTEGFGQAAAGYGGSLLARQPAK
jgi:hypothetical protein